MFSNLLICILIALDNSDALSAHCSAKYGGMTDDNQHLLKELQQYANLHIKRSFEYLLVSTHFANYEHNRVGFEKLFHKLSDETWNDGIEIIKHITKRGGVHRFDERMPLVEKDKPNYEDYELQAMAKAVDVQKHLAEKALDIHRDALKHHKDHGHSLHDAEIAHYIEEEFAEKQAESVRTLVGHVTDLRKLLLEGKDGSLALHLFDEYLQK